MTILCKNDYFGQKYTKFDAAVKWIENVEMSIEWIWFPICFCKKLETFSLFKIESIDIFYLSGWPCFWPRYTVLLLFTNITSLKILKIFDQISRIWILLHLTNLEGTHFGTPVWKLDIYLSCRARILLFSTLLFSFKLRIAKDFLIQ